MKKKDFENELNKIGIIKKYHSTEKNKNFDYYVDEEKFFIFGVIKEKNKYIAFFKDFEREKHKETGEFSTEDEAYEYLIEIIRVK